MKTKFKSFGNIHTILGILLMMLLAQTTSASTVITNEFWISTNATGNFYSSHTGGTIDNPLDGSTQPNFDNNMNSLPEHSTIHILAGIYQTEGSAGFTVKTGTKIWGSGVDVTILQLTNLIPTDNYVINSVYTATNIEVSDLTCDCNYTSGSFTTHGILLQGTGHAIRRVKLINQSKMGTANSESWGLIIKNATLDHSDGNIIEECEVSGFKDGTLNGAAYTVLGFNANPGYPMPSGIIRDNRIIGKPLTQGVINPLAVSSDTVVEGNYITGADSVCHNENGLTNLLFINNVIKKSRFGIEYELGSNYRNLTFAFNQIELTTSVGLGVAFFFRQESATNIVILGNTVTVAPGGTGTPWFIFADNGPGVVNITGLTVAYNTVDSACASDVTGCVNVNMDNNYDLFGNYLLNLNVPTIGGRAVTPIGLSLASSAGASSALTTLGLPSNPLVVVTNGSTIPVIFNTNVTVIGVLNYSNMVAQLLAGTGVTTSTFNTSTGQVVTVNATVQTNGCGFNAMFTGTILRTSANSGVLTTFFKQNISNITISAISSGNCTVKVVFTNSMPDTNFIFIQSSDTPTVVSTINPKHVTDVSINFTGASVPSINAVPFSFSIMR